MVAKRVHNYTHRTNKLVSLLSIRRWAIRVIAIMPSGIDKLAVHSGLNNVTHAGRPGFEPEIPLLESGSFPASLTPPSSHPDGPRLREVALMPGIEPGSAD